jgi:CRP-like cAMP-binding protein
MGKQGIDPGDRELIRSAPIFSGLPAHVLDALLQRSEFKLQPRRLTLFEQDEPADIFYLVLDGWVKLFRMTAGGDEAVVGLFTRGDCVAEVPCLTRGIYPVSAQTVTEARLLAVSAASFAELAQANPEICLPMIASIALHLRELVDQIEELKARTGPQRLASFLVGLAPVLRGPCTIVLPYEKLLIAGRLGMKPESLSRAFQRLKSVGVRIDHDTVAVRDVAQLAEFAGCERLMAIRCPLFRPGVRPN